jgi:hypothetical protein
MTFRPDVSPVFKNSELRNLAAWASRQLYRLSNEQQISNFVILAKQYKAPDKPQDGQIAYADGTEWNPGSGRGAYRYDATGSTWQLLG